MEVTPEQLLDIFKAAYRLGEATKTYKPNPLVVASDSEIEADAFPIMGSILKREFYFSRPRQGGRSRQLSLAQYAQKNSELYKGVL